MKRYDETNYAGIDYSLGTANTDKRGIHYGVTPAHDVPYWYDEAEGDFILKSPYYTYAQFCSPCAPGAGYLPSPLKDRPAGNKTYCLGHDWFEDGTAPYRVYSVKTNKEMA